jgi:hypothetical protein
MDYLATILERLATSDVCGYQSKAPAATEPTALTALALLAHDRAAKAEPLVQRLLEMQNADGSLGIDRLQREPGWPTGWAVLAWRAAQKSAIFAPEFVDANWRGRNWILSIVGDAADPEDWQGHDAQVRGWPWVVGTHSWVEPTAINLLALKHNGQAQHRRARDAVTLLVDRLLPDGGCNYGNTVVFGQALRPHLQPTGITLLALQGESDPSGRLDRSVAYLQRELSESTTTASLCHGLLGLAAQGAWPAEAHDWLAAATHRTLARDASSYKMALIALAALGPECPLVSGFGLSPQADVSQEATTS